MNGWRIHGLRTGVGRYLLNVVKHWSPGLVAGQFSEINFSTPRALEHAGISFPENIRERVLASDWPMLVWENLRLAPVVRDDVLFCPSYSRPLATRARVVVTTHDAVQKIHPELFPTAVRVFYSPLYGWSARHATLVITDSEAGRRDIARYWGVPISRIRVVYLAPAEIFRPLPDAAGVNSVRKHYVGSDAPFFLFVGKMSGRRNLRLLLRAFADLKRRRSWPHRLLLVGPNPRQLKIPALLAELGIWDDVKHWAYVSDDHLNAIYNAAEALISPSVYETVSLPVMEAQATGTPVICIDSAGMREITGSAALMIPKLDVDELAEAMASLAADGALRRELAAQGLARARQFSWARCASETLAVLEEAAGLPRPVPPV